MNQLTRRVQAMEDEFSDILEQCWEISIYDGWTEIVYDLLSEIRKNFPQVKVVQIKQKFGGLRFYVDNSSKEFNDLITAAEVKANQTCEITGEKGSERSINGWIYTVSDQVYEEAKRFDSWGAYLRSISEKS